MLNEAAAYNLPLPPDDPWRANVGPLEWPG